jgi:methyl-accepting chemotaxis protein/sigma-B regulation protein RsbU (phosphoserine phosphatase)
MEPQREHQDEGNALTTFRLPLYEGQKVVGMFDVDVSLTQLSKIMAESKPSPHSFCALIGKDGKLIVFPDSTFLNKNAFELSRKYDNDAEVEAIHAMMSGGTGYKYVKMEGEDCYVFYKPFVRADVPGRAKIDLGWSAGIIYPEDDIFGDYNRLLYMVLVIAVVGLLLLFIHCRVFIHRQFMPLRQLERSAKAIAEGSYDEPIPHSHRLDEIGRLQKHFQRMQRSLATRVGEMQRASALLQERGEVLQAAYEQAQAGDRMKTNFLYNMSDQMMTPINEVCERVMIISDHVNEITEEDTNRFVDEIQQRGGQVTALLNQLIADSETIIH